MFGTCIVVNNIYNAVIRYYNVYITIFKITYIIIHNYFRLNCLVLGMVVQLVQHTALNLMSEDFITALISILKREESIHSYYP